MNNNGKININKSAILKRGAFQRTWGSWSVCSLLVGLVKLAQDQRRKYLSGFEDLELEIHFLQLTLKPVFLV